MNAPDRQTRSSTYGVILIIASSCCFSLMSLGVRTAKEYFHADSIVFYRSLIALLLLTPWHREFFQSGWTLREKFRVHFWRGTFGIASMYFLYAALQRLPFSLVTPLTLTSVIWATLFARFFLHERVRLGQIACAIIVLSGVLFVVFSTTEGASGWHFDAVGVACGLACGLSMGAALTTLRKMRKNLSTKDIVYFFSWCGVLIMFPAVLVRAEIPRDISSASYLLWIGVTATAAQLFMTSGFRYTSTFTATVAKQFETLLNVTLGILILGEFPPAMFYVGLVLVLSGMAGLALARQK